MVSWNDPFTPRESEVFEKSGFKIFKALSHAAKHRIRLRRFQSTPNQLRILSTFRKTKFEHLIRLRSRVIALQSWYGIGSTGVKGLKVK